MQQLATALALIFNPTTGALEPGSFGGSVAVVTPDQVWDITFDGDTAGSYAQANAYLVMATLRSAVGAAARMCVYQLQGSALRVTCIDPATGLAANAGASVMVRADRNPANY